MTEDGAKKHGVNRILIVIVVALPLFLLVGRELARGELIYYMRAVDFADIFILAPLYTAILIFLWNYMWLHSPTKSASGCLRYLRYSVHVWTLHARDRQRYQYICHRGQRLP